MFDGLFSYCGGGRRDHDRLHEEWSAAVQAADAAFDAECFEWALRRAAVPKPARRTIVLHLGLDGVLSVARRAEDPSDQHRETGTYAQLPVAREIPSQLDVLVPLGFSAGDQMSVEAPGHGVVCIAVPASCSSGDRFRFTVSTPVKTAEVNDTPAEDSPQPDEINAPANATPINDDSATPEDQPQPSNESTL